MLISQGDNLPSLLIKFPSPLRLLWRRQAKPHCRQVGKTRPVAEPPVSLHLHREGRAPARDPRRHPSCWCPLPSGWACSCPAQRPRAGCGQARRGCLAFPSVMSIYKDNQDV